MTAPPLSLAVWLSNVVLGLSAPPPVTVRVTCGLAFGLCPALTDRSVGRSHGGSGPGVLGVGRVHTHAGAAVRDRRRLVPPHRTSSSGARYFRCRRFGRG